MRITGPQMIETKMTVRISPISPTHTVYVISVGLQSTSTSLTQHSTNYNVSRFTTGFHRKAHCGSSVAAVALAVLLVHYQGCRARRWRGRETSKYGMNDRHHNVNVPGFLSVMCICAHSTVVYCYNCRQSINQSINQVYYFSSTLQARFHNKQ